MNFKVLSVLALAFMAGSVVAQETSPGVATEEVSASAAQTVAMPPPADGLRMTYDVDGAPVVWQRDAKGAVQIDGLAYPGLVLYVPQTGTVYYQHPDEVGWVSVTPAMLEGYAYPALLLQGGKWQPYLDAPTRRWEVKAAQLSCDNWFASAKAGAVTGLTARDIWQVFDALAWLHAGTAVPVCERMAVSAEDGKKVGLPMYFTGPGGRWQLTELGRTAVADIPLPATPEPADDAVRVRLLLHQFGPEDRADMLREMGSLPAAQQVLYLQKLMAEQAAY
ncbi:MAG: hypothetical protein H6922_02300 [Pseudomonadaceae bacterium]|nr:hypothetical protein [Pseudomonadaceae bacterium]